VFFCKFKAINPSRNDPETTIWFACLLLARCAVPKKLAVADPAIIRAFPQPVTIFGIGYWGSDDMGMNT
jgi:hypothetical protein